MNRDRVGVKGQDRCWMEGLLPLPSQAWILAASVCPVTSRCQGSCRRSLSEARRSDGDLLVLKSRFLAMATGLILGLVSTTGAVDLPFCTLELSTLVGDRSFVCF